VESTTPLADMTLSERLAYLAGYLHTRAWELIDQSLAQLCAVASPPASLTAAIASQKEMIKNLAEAGSQVPPRDDDTLHRLIDALRSAQRTVDDEIIRWWDDAETQRTLELWLKVYNVGLYSASVLDAIDEMVLGRAKHAQDEFVRRLERPARESTDEYPGEPDLVDGDPTPGDGTAMVVDDQDEPGDETEGDRMLTPED
jgi:hypothetical protein